MRNGNILEYINNNMGVDRLMLVRCDLHDHYNQTA